MRPTRARAMATDAALFACIRQVCSQEAAAALLDRRNCSKLQSCIEEAVASSQLPPWNYTQPHASHAAVHSSNVLSSGGELAAWFLFFFVVRHTMGDTMVKIPYDALGQELTNASEERQVCSSRGRA